MTEAPVRIAAIDIGTNSALLTIVEHRADHEMRTLCEEAEITRIGEGLGTAETFCEPAMDRTLALLRHYADRCREFHVERISAVGTAAFRRAHNSAEFVQRVERACGLRIQIISGQKEAQLSFHAAAHDFGDDLFVLDIGGGSTEFMWIDGDAVQAHSFPIGSVTLHEEFCHHDPISDDEYQTLQRHLQSSLAIIAPRVRQRPAQLVALAGSATTLAAMHLELAVYSHDQVHGTILTREQIDMLLHRLRYATLAERKQMRGLEPQRADVILSGALLLHETMRQFGFSQVTISDRGVRWGLIYEALASQ